MKFLRQKPEKCYEFEMFFQVFQRGRWKDAGTDDSGQGWLKLRDW